MHWPMRIAGGIVDWLSDELNKASVMRRNNKGTLVISPADKIRIQLRTPGPAWLALCAREQAAAGNCIRGRFQEQL